MFIDPDDSSGWILLVEDFGDGALVDEGGDGVDVGCERAIGGDFGRGGADGIVGFLGEGAGLQRGEQVDALAGAEKFDGEDVAEIVEHAFQAAGAAHAHADVVFLITGSGNRIDRVRCGERAIFAGKRGGCYLRDHEAGIETGIGR